VLASAKELIRTTRNVRL